jgi:hypothetical protein
MDEPECTRLTAAVSPFLSLHLGTSRTSARAVLDQSPVRVSVTEPTSVQRFSGSKGEREEGSTAQCRAVIGRPAEDWDFPTNCRGMSMAWHGMSCYDEMRMMEGLFCVTDRRILRIKLSNLQQLFTEACQTLRRC